ncbi:MAG: hypothetical protein ACREOS_06360 [Candidatus Dormibacteraceae bacterium]
MSVMRNQSRPTTRSEWLSALSDACRTLARAPEEVIRSMSVTARLPEGPDVPWPVLELARRIAEEYQVRAQTRREGDFLTVRFQRPVGDESER